MLSFRVFGVFRGSLLFGDKSEYVVAAPQYRAAANTAMGWKNSPRIAQQSYLLVTEDDFAKAAGVAKVMLEG